MDVLREKRVISYIRLVACTVDRHYNDVILAKYFYENFKKLQ